MHETDPEQGLTADPLAEIIRTAGRRSEPPREHYDQVFEATRLAWQHKLRSRRQKRWLALAASVAALIITGTLVQNLLISDTVLAARIAVAQGDIELRLDDDGLWQSVEGDLNLAPGTHLRTRNDSRAALALSAGGLLRLDTATEIVVGLSQYELVTGTLYFDSIGRAPNEPLAIATPHGIVRDIGTQFQLSASDDLLRVRVRSGRIEITDTLANADISSDAGSEIELSASGVSIQREFAADDAAWGWAESLAIAPSSGSILTYLNWIANETGKQLRFDSNYVQLAAGNVQFAGNPAGHTPMEVLRLIQDTSDFDFEFTSDGSILIQRIDDP